MQWFLYLLLFFSSQLFAGNEVRDYQRIFLPVYTPKKQLLIALRVFKMNNIPSFLTVDPDTLETQIIPICKLKPRTLGNKKPLGHLTHWKVTSTLYYQLLNKNTAAPYVLSNQGLTHVDGMQKGNILTIDLCPSRKPFELSFFNALVKRADQTKQPTPITIAISGLWLLEHPEEFQWLLRKKKQKKLDITWVNHSFSHPYYSDLPYAENFLLAKETNPEVEFLLTEKYLLEAGEIPSVFFRFPGLISNEELINESRKLGLIPLGADAWLARHQKITPGGIILVHGNSNEHAGILELVSKLHALRLVDIRAALAKSQEFILGFNDRSGARSL